MMLVIEIQEIVEYLRLVVEFVFGVENICEYFVDMCDIFCYVINDNQLVIYGLMEV